MKKSAFISVLVILFSAFSCSEINIACAQTIKCEVQERKYCGEIFLSQYNDDGNKEGRIWVFEFVNSLLTDNDRRFLDQVNGQIIRENDACYDQLLEISSTLTELDYNPLARHMSPQIRALNSEVLNILQGLINA